MSSVTCKSCGAHNWTDCHECGIDLGLQKENAKLREQLAEAQEKVLDVVEELEEVQRQRDGYRFDYEAISEEGYDHVVEHATKLNELLEKNLELMNRKSPYENRELKEAQARVAELEEGLRELGDILRGK